MITALCLLAIVAAGVSTLSVTMIAASLLYAGTQGLHHYAASSLPAEAYAPYYYSAMTVDAACVGLMLMIMGAIGKDWHLWPLSIIFTLSIVNDIYGLIAWRSFAVSDTFDAIGYVLYVAVAVVLAGSRYSDNLADLCRRGSFLCSKSVRGGSVGAEGSESCKT